MVLAVIPARYASTRFPGKPLALIGQSSMIARTYHRVSSAKLVNEVWVATDDRRIFDHVQSFGGNVVMTAPEHRSGTDRVAEVARDFPLAEIVVNVQGDEPFIDPTQIDAVIKPFTNAGVDVATLAHPITEERSLLSPDVVKVVRDASGKALYFSRHALPFLRGVPVGRWLERGKHLQHLGLYAYRGDVLQRLAELPTGPLEAAESLEQLRWLEHGLAIHVALTDIPAFGIDTPDDLREALNRLKIKE